MLLSIRWISSIRCDKLFGEVTPRRSHHGATFFTKIEMTLLLIVFHISCLKDWVSCARIILEFAASSCFKIVGISTKLIVSTDLIQIDLVTHEFIFSEVYWIFFLSKTFKLLSSKVLAPRSGVVPMGSLQFVFIIFVHKFPLLISIAHKLTIVTSIIARLQSAYGKVGLTHFVFLDADIEISFLSVDWVLILSCACFWVVFYRQY